MMLTDHQRESVRYYKASAERFLTARGFDVRKLPVQFENPKERFEAWLAESLHYAVDAISRGERKLALRALLQAHEYRGRIGGYWPSPTFSDAAVFVQQRLEDELTGNP